MVLSVHLYCFRLLVTLITHTKIFQLCVSLFANSEQSAEVEKLIGTEIESTREKNLKKNYV